MKRLIHQVLKKPLSGTFLLAAAILMLSMLSSCKDEDEKEASIGYTLALTDDVLEYLEPTVTCTTPSGTETITLTADDFQAGDNNSSIFQWHKQYKYDHFDVTTNMSVSFRQIKEISDEDNSRQFNYLAEINATVHTKLTTSTDHITNTDLGQLFFIAEPVSREEFAQHIADLVANGLTKTVVIDSNGNINP